MIIKNNMCLLTIFFSLAILSTTAFAVSPIQRAEAALQTQNEQFTQQLLASTRPRFQDLTRLPYLSSMQLPASLFTQENRENTRSKIKESFEHYIYGYAPDIRETNAVLVSRRIMTFENTTTSVEVLDYDLQMQVPGVNRENYPKLRLSLFLPVNASPNSIFIALNKCGNHMISRKIEVSPRDLGFTHADCGEPEYANTHTDSFWNLDEIISQGFGFATFHESDLAPDNNRLANTKIKHFYNFAPYSGENGWGNIAVWAWGLRTVAHSLKENSLTQHAKLVTIGHSRRGKAALLAAAFDENINMAVPHQSGTLGLASARNDALLSPQTYYERYGNLDIIEVSSEQETLAINDFIFDHWFNRYSERFKHNEDRLPVDQHLLLALMAPRPVLSTEGTRDRWANFESSLVTLNLGASYYNYAGIEQGSVQIIEDASAIDCQNPDFLVQARLNTGHTLTREYWHIIFRQVECVLN